MLLILCTAVDCGNPLPASEIFIEPFDATKFGSLITFHCEESNNSMTAVCGSDGEWEPDLTSYNCRNSMYCEERFSYIYYVVFPNHSFTKTDRLWYSSYCLWSYH